MEQKVARKLKIYDQSNGVRSVPTLMIKGEWFKGFGFNSGDYVEVKCEKEKLIITRLDEKMISIVIDNLCPNCQTKFKKKTKYCSNCGFKLV